MTKPIKTDIAANLQGWDAAVDDNFSALFGGSLPDQNPMPVPETTSALPDPADWAFCLIYDVANSKLMFSNGTDWGEVTVTV